MNTQFMSAWHKLKNYFATHRRCIRFCFVLAWLAVSSTQAQTTNLGTSTILELPAAGSDSVVLAVTPPSAPWTATTNAAWLHLTAPNQSGTGSTNVIFGYDANTGATRSGTLTIAGQTLTVTQLGSTYAKVTALTTIISSNLPYYTWMGLTSTPNLTGLWNLAVSGSGRGYATVGGSYQEIVTWSPTNNYNLGVYDAMDGLGDLTVDDAGNLWAASSDQPIYSVIYGPETIETRYYAQALSADGAGDLYFVDLYYGIREWYKTNETQTTLVPSVFPQSTAVDAAGNIYFDYTLGLTEWLAANSNSIALIPPASLTNGAGDVNVDGGGHVYFASDSIQEWLPASDTVTTLIPGQGAPMALDTAGNIYVVKGTSTQVIQELPYAFVDTATKAEGLGAGSDTLSPVLPSTVNLLPPFAPSSDQPWLTITGVTNGVVSFSFTADAGPARIGHISLLGQTIAVTQGLIVVGTPPTLIDSQNLGNGVCQFSFTNTPNAYFEVLTATNLSVPFSNWTLIGTASNIASNMFQFTTPPNTNGTQRYYTVRSL